MAKASRQKFASVPPSSLADRVAQTTDTENKMVVRKEASTGRIISRTPCQVQGLSFVDLSGHKWTPFQNRNYSAGNPDFDHWELHHPPTVG